MHLSILFKYGWSNKILVSLLLLSIFEYNIKCSHEDFNESIFFQMLAHRLFPNAKYSIWVDSKSQFRRDPLGVLDALLWRTNSVLAISEHGARSSVYDEAKAVVKKHKATPEEVEVQINQYRHDKLPEDKRFNGKKGNFLSMICVVGKYSNFEDGK